MRTDKFETVQSPESIAKCCKYSDNPEALRKLLVELSIGIRFDGIKKHFFDDKEERLTGTFSIERGKRKIEFAFGFSIRDTENVLFNPVKTNGWTRFDGERVFINSFGDTYKYKLRKEKWLKEFMNDLLYSCLTSCRSDFYCSKSFEDFCGEYGYDTDSKKAEKTWKACLEQSAKLERIFTAEEIECLPS